MNKSIAPELKLRIARIQKLMIDSNIASLLVSDNANLYYTAGKVFSGYTYIPEKGEALYFVKRPITESGDNVIIIRKPEQIVEELKANGIELSDNIALELDLLSYSETSRLQKVFPNCTIKNASPIMRKVRSVKTDMELELLKESGIHHAESYRRIPKLYKRGMSDLELQIEIERQMRLLGCLGQFRISGSSMEIFMGNLICGDNADAPSPYDFAMGGAGLDASLPVGCNGTVIKPGMSVMVDIGGNFTGYMTDMTRVFSLGDIGVLAHKAHSVSLAIHDSFKNKARAGVAASDIYNMAVEIAEANDLGDYFMGHAQKAGFVGHGVGIEVNELPVLAPRSRDILEINNVIALEPKFVIPNVGAVGVENTYIITEDGAKCITNAPTEIISLD